MHMEDTHGHGKLMGFGHLATWIYEVGFIQEITSYAWVQRVRSAQVQASLIT